MTDAPTPANGPTIYTTLRRFAPLAVVVFCAGLLVIVGIIRPFESPDPSITIDRPLVGIGFDPTGAYMIIHDAGGKDRLVSASSPVAASVTFQTFATTTSTTEGEVVIGDTTTDLITVESFDVPGFSDLRLVPGSAQLLLSGLTAPLTEGQIVPITLVFERSGSITVDAVAASYNDIADRLLPPRLITN